MSIKTKPLDAATAATIAAALATAVQEQGTSLPADSAAELPANGQQVTVQDPAGVLINLETGRRFEAGVPTPQRMTTHTRQRLQDGGLVLVV